MNSSLVFRLRLFGSTSLAGEDAALSGPAVQRHRLALLALLALAPPQRLSRAKPIGNLWPESAEAKRIIDIAPCPPSPPLSSIGLARTVPALP